MAFGSAPSTHRKREKSYIASAKHSIDSFHKHLKKGNCTAARSSLISAAEAAGVAYGEARGYARHRVRGKRKSPPAFYKHPAIKMVTAAKKEMSAKCIVKFKGRKK